MRNRPSSALAEASESGEALARGARRREMAHELAKIGLRLARRAAEVAEAAADDGAAGCETIAQAGLAYSRIAGAVRLALALEALVDGDVFLQGERVRAALAERAEKAAQGRQAERQQAIRKDVRRAIRVHAGGDRWTLGRLFDELDEALGDEDDWDLLTELSIGEAAARICRDLDVPFDPELWNDADEGPDLDDGGGINPDEPPGRDLIAACPAANPPPDANGHRPP